MLPAEVRHTDQVPPEILIIHLLSSIAAINARLDEITFLHEQEFLRSHDVRERMARLKETRKCLQESLIKVGPQLSKDVFQR